MMQVTDLRFQLIEYVHPSLSTEPEDLPLEPFATCPDKYPGQVHPPGAVTAHWQKLEDDYAATQLRQGITPEDSAQTVVAGRER